MDKEKEKEIHEKLGRIWSPYEIFVSLLVVGMCTLTFWHLLNPIQLFDDFIRNSVIKSFGRMYELDLSQLNNEIHLCHDRIQKLTDLISQLNSSHNATNTTKIQDDVKDVKDVKDVVFKFIKGSVMLGGIMFLFFIVGLIVGGFARDTILEQLKRVTDVIGLIGFFMLEIWSVIIRWGIQKYNEFWYS
jgi:hypothetical protein